MEYYACRYRHSFVNGVLEWPRCRLESFDTHCYCCDTQPCKIRRVEERQTSEAGHHRRAVHQRQSLLGLQFDRSNRG